MPKENRAYWKPKLERNVTKQKADIKRPKKGWVECKYSLEVRDEK